MTELPNLFQNIVIIPIRAFLSNSCLVLIKVVQLACWNRPGHSLGHILPDCDRKTK